MSKEEADLIKLLISLRDANAMAVEAINAYLEATAPPEVKVEKVEELFPDDLRAMLTFEAQPDATIVRPKQFLGSEVFMHACAPMPTATTQPPMPTEEDPL